MHHRGFSFIELSVILSIVAVSLTVMLPDASGWIMRSRLERCAQDVLTFVSHAKGLAIARHAAWTITVSSAEHGHDWMLRLGAKNSTTESVMTLSSQDYPQIMVEFHYLEGALRVDGLRGKLSNGHILIYPIHQADAAVKLVTSYGASRSRLCAVSVRRYGLPRC